MNKKFSSGQAKLFRMAGIFFGLIGLGLLIFNLWRGSEGILLYLGDLAMLVAAVGLYMIGKNAEVIEDEEGA